MNEPTKHAIETAIQERLHPLHLEVENISKMHKVPPNAETHFRLTIVTPEFIPLNLIKRHRLINELLQNFLDNGVHALTMNLYTPEEWKAFGPQANPPPKCQS